jgi:hypothetical protein
MILSQCSLTTDLLRHRPNQKPDHLGQNSDPKCQQKYVGVYVFACIERSSWLDSGRDHGDEVTLKIIVEKYFTMTLHAQICPVLRDYIQIKYYWSHGAIRPHQSRTI